MEMLVASVEAVKEGVSGGAGEHEVAVLAVAEPGAEMRAAGREAKATEVAGKEAVMRAEGMVAVMEAAAKVAAKEVVAVVEGVGGDDGGGRCGGGDGGGGEAEGRSLVTLALRAGAKIVTTG